MPSFVVASPGCGIDRYKDLASKFGIEVSTYQATKSNNPTTQEFAKFLQDFDEFCEKNKNSTCDMFMLTGYHGEYAPISILNNLSKQQLHQLVETAEKHDVKFNHILSDSCCAAFGLKELKGMLANGGEAIGDRTTSTAYKLQDKLIEKMILEDAQQSHDEKKLIAVVIEEGMNTLNAPIYIITTGTKIAVLGTTDAEVYQNIISTYKNSGLIEQNLSDKEAEARLRQMGLRSDFDQLKEDLRKSRWLFTINEKNNRKELLSLRQQYQMKDIEENLPINFKNNYSFLLTAGAKVASGISIAGVLFTGLALKKIMEESSYDNKLMLGISSAIALGGLGLFKALESIEGKLNEEEILKMDY